VAHAARHVAHHVRRAAHHATRPFRHPVRHIAHHALRHPGKIIIAACCAGAIGPGGGALSAAPTSAPRAAYAAPLPASAGWPEMPNYTGMGGGIIGIGGGGAALIPVYGKTPAPQLLEFAPPIASTRGTPPIQTTSVPEPSSVAVFLLPGLWVLLVRRRMQA